MGGHEFNRPAPVNGGHIELIGACRHGARIQTGIKAALIRAGSKLWTHVPVYYANIPYMRRVYCIRVGILQFCSHAHVSACKNTILTIVMLRIDFYFLH